MEGLVVDTWLGFAVRDANGVNGGICVDSVDEIEVGIMDFVTEEISDAEWLGYIVWIEGGNDNGIADSTGEGFWLGINDCLKDGCK